MAIIGLYYYARCGNVTTDEKTPITKSVLIHKITCTKKEVGPTLALLAVCIN
jgi:hypothetical protein